MNAEGHIGDGAVTKTAGDTRREEGSAWSNARAKRCAVSSTRRLTACRQALTLGKFSRHSQSRWVVARSRPVAFAAANEQPSATGCLKSSRSLDDGPPTRVPSPAGWRDRLMANIAAGDLRTFDSSSWEPRGWPATCRGVGYVEGPRGALGHWVVIQDKKITNYQAVVPTTWNAGPVDAAGQHGPYEAALLDRHTLTQPDKPLEILRTIHSFDPCLACAAHVLGPERSEIVRVKVV